MKLALFGILLLALSGCAATGGLPGYNAPKYKPIFSPVPAMIPAGE